MARNHLPANVQASANDSDGLDYDFQRSGLKLYAIDDPIAKAVLDGAIQSSPAQRFVVLTGLELLIRRET